MLAQLITMFSKSIIAILAVICALVASTSALQLPKPRGVGAKPVAKKASAPAAAPAKKAFSFPSFSFGAAPVAPPAPVAPKKSASMGGVPKWASDFIRQQGGGL